MKTFVKKLKYRFLVECTKIEKASFLFIIYLFNSLFTVDFSIVIVTNLHRLTENLIIKGKI